MGLFDKLKGIKKPEEGVAPAGPEELKQKLLVLSGDQVPFTVVPGAGGKDGDLIVEWKIVDAQWYEIFAKASLEKSHKIYLTLDRKTNEVRVLEESWEVEWRAGVPNLSLSAEAFRGRTMTSKSFGTAYAWKGVDPLDYGQVYEYRFDVSEMKDPIAETVTRNGWTFRPVTTKGGLVD
ncbi:MAG TPA: hypothetical protein VNC78_03220 [Actinomycetota bacterium]|nr:hypothetical protein [Actinomycetota bacterium]